MTELTNETAWWQPRAGKQLKNLATPELQALAAGLDTVLGEFGSCGAAHCNKSSGLQKSTAILSAVKAELAERGNPLVTQ